MAYKTTVKQRIQQFAETTNLEDKYFELRVGMASGSLRKGSNPTSPMLEKIKASYPRLDMNWVITGLGPMLLPEKARIEDAPATSDTIDSSEVAEEQAAYANRYADAVQVNASILLSLNEQLKRKDEQIAFLQAELHKLLAKL